MEIYLDGRWGFICGEGWSQTSAQVVCRHLGLTGNRAYSLLIIDCIAGRKTPETNRKVNRNDRIELFHNLIDCISTVFYYLTICVVLIDLAKDI